MIRAGEKRKVLPRLGKIARDVFKPFSAFVVRNWNRHF